MLLQNKNVIITGASQGFGYNVAKRFVEAGANVAICARNSNQLREATSTLKKHTSDQNQVISMQADISDQQQVNNFVAFVIKEFGSLDVIISNAGIYGPKGAIESIDWNDWSSAIDINLKGTVLLCREILPYLKQNKKGKIIILSGGGATKPMPFLSAYAASKAAIVRFAETLSEETKDFNIDVNTIAPGALNTRLLEEILIAGPNKVGKEFYEQSLKQRETGGAPLDKGADLCIYLASEESNGITGKLISAIWDPWETFKNHLEDIKNSDIYTLRRIIPEERGIDWSDEE